MKTKLTDLAVAFFGKEAVENVKSQGFTVRDIWEFSTPTTQCNNVVGKINKSTSCWICGMPILKVDGMSAECEHILPVAQAVVFLVLYNDKIKEEASKDIEYMNRMLNLEYGWAHVVCNQEKSESCPIRRNKHDRNHFHVDEDEVEKMLKDIYNSDRIDANKPKGFKARLKQMYKSPQAFVASRKRDVSDKYNAIIAFINAGQKGDNRPTNLMMLAGIARLGEEYITREALHGVLDEEGALEKSMQLLQEKKKALADIMGEKWTTIQEDSEYILTNLKEKMVTRIANLHVSDRTKAFYEKIGINKDDPLVNFSSSLIELYPDVVKAMIELNPAVKKEEILAALTTFLTIEFFVNILNNIEIHGTKGKATQILLQKVENIIDNLRKEIDQKVFETLQAEYEKYKNSLTPDALAEIETGASVLKGLRAASLVDTTAKGPSISRKRSRGENMSGLKLLSSMFEGWRRNVRRKTRRGRR